MRWVILDLDALLVADPDGQPQNFERRATDPASLAAIARLSRAEYEMVMIAADDGRPEQANDAAALGRMHVRINDQLLPLGGRIQASLFCPHGSDENCACRPPQPGLLASIGERLQIDLARTPVASTRVETLEAAECVGAPTVWLGGPPTPAGTRAAYASLADWVARARCCRCARPCSGCCSPPRWWFSRSC